MLELIVLIVGIISMLPPILWTYGSYRQLRPIIRIANVCVACIPLICSLGYIVPRIMLPHADDIRMILGSIVPVAPSTATFTATLIACSSVLCLVFILLNELLIAQSGKQLIPAYRKPIYIVGTCGYLVMYAATMIVIVVG